MLLHGFNEFKDYNDTRQQAGLVRVTWKEYCKIVEIMAQGMGHKGHGYMVKPEAHKAAYDKLLEVLPKDKTSDIASRKAAEDDKSTAVVVYRKPQEPRPESPEKAPVEGLTLEAPVSLLGIEEEILVN